MAYRRDGKVMYQTKHDWHAWLKANAALIRDAGLPPTTVRTRDDWDYLLRYGYHCDGAYPNVDFSLDELTKDQAAALRVLLERTLTDEEKQRGNAAWHHVCPPENEAGDETDEGQR